MARLSDKIAKNNSAERSFQVPQPVFKMAMPDVKIGSPKVTIAKVPVDVQVDMSPVSAPVEKLAQMIGMLQQQQVAMLKVIEEQTRQIAKLAGNKPQINVAPAKLPARPKSLYIELDKEDGETIGMRVTANSSN